MRTVIFNVCVEFHTEVHLVVSKSQPASSVLGSCKKFKHQDYFSNYLQFYPYISLKAQIRLDKNYYTKAGNHITEI